MDYDKLTREEIVNMYQTLWQKNADLEKNTELYREQLKKNQQKLYGKSSEKISLVLQNEMDLFDEADTLAYEDEQEEAVNIAEHKRHEKKKYTMDNLPRDIEKEYRDYDLENKDWSNMWR